MTPGRKSRPQAPPTTEAHGLARMLQLHHDGASLTTIAAALNAERYHTVHGQRWHSASVARVIADTARSDASRQQRSTRAAQ